MMSQKKRRTIGENPLDALITVSESVSDSDSAEEQVPVAEEERAPEDQASSSEEMTPPVASAQRLGASRSRSTQQRRRGLVFRAKGGPRVRATVYLPPEVGEKLRRWCFDHDQDVTVICSEAIVKMVAKLPEK